MITAATTEFALPKALLERVRERAAAVDAARTDTGTVLRELGGTELFERAAARDVAAVAAALEALAGECLASAFSAWGHAMAVMYHAAAGVGVPAGLLDGSIIGASAMAPAFKSASGLGDIPVRAVPDAGGYRLEGSLTWASNLFPDALVVHPALLADGQARVVRTRIGATGVEVRPARDLLALNGTASGSIALHGVHIDEAELFEPRLPDFLASVRAPFLLLQSAFCFGIASRSLHEASEVIGRPGPASLFAGRLTRLRERERTLRAEHTDLVRQPGGAVRLLELRLAAAELVDGATGLEAAVTGGRGFIATSPTARRRREGSFLPVQSPTEGHLRWELATRKR